MYFALAFLVLKILLVPLPSIEIFSTILINNHLHYHTTQKNNKYLRVCADNDVSSLPFIVESNGYLHLKGRSNLYNFFTSILFAALQSAFSDAIITHSPPTLSDSDVATAHICT